MSSLMRAGLIICGTIGKAKRLLGAVLMIVLVASAALAENEHNKFAYVGYGYGIEKSCGALYAGYEGKRASLELCGITGSTYSRYGSINDYPCPWQHTAFANNAVYCGIVLDYNAHIEIVENLKLYAGVGIYAMDYQNLSISSKPITNPLYRESTAWSCEPAFQAGIEYRFGDYLLRGGYHTLRGINAAFGFVIR